MVFMVVYDDSFRAFPFICMHLKTFWIYSVMKPLQSNRKFPFLNIALFRCCFILDVFITFIICSSISICATLFDTLNDPHFPLSTCTPDCVFSFLETFSFIQIFLHKKFSLILHDYQALASDFIGNQVCLMFFFFIYWKIEIKFLKQSFASTGKDTMKKKQNTQFNQNEMKKKNRCNLKFAQK